MKGLFITATDTGAGKTYAACLVLKALRDKGVDACGMKPFESGLADLDKPEDSDAHRLLSCSSAIAEPLELISPYRFKEPLAPWVAAEREGRAVEVARVMRAARELGARHKVLIVEGVGGLMAPIMEGYYVRELALEFGLPVVIVVGVKLGAINHTLLSVEAAASAGLKLAGLVLNCHGDKAGGLAESTTSGAIKRLLPHVPVLAELGPGAREVDAAPFIEALR